MTHDTLIAPPEADVLPPESDDATFSVTAAVHGHVAGQLKKLRLANGITQTEMGGILRLTYLQVHKYERGLCRVPLERIWLAAEHFGLEVAYFFDGLETSTRRRILRTEDDDNQQLRLALSQSMQLIHSPKMLRSLLHLTRAMTLVAEETARD